ncbi:putative ferrooxidoreductase protein [Botryosphaeria dothidea]|uniref:Ferrooxidoreductase protein n=1 Tax=Botryosphaeria dothidea TaxID=55169 RepID=A0A8H4N0E4_9PEZI|nr:putative ferrooxidoreductase protein [Botryosphaeria dothidea]
MGYSHPDGMLERPVIGINGQWPPPLLNFTKGDRVIANVYNALAMKLPASTSTDFTKMAQTTWTAPREWCSAKSPPNPPSTYNFRINQSGTLLNFTLSLEPGKTYLVHLANVGAFAGQYFWIEGHTMRIVEVDGIWTEPAEADMIYVASAQRYAVLLTTKNDTSAKLRDDGQYGYRSV